MIKRCYQPTTSDYHLYGGSGIRVCERWMIFTNFLSDMGERPNGMTLNRINNSGDYFPENCHWATPKEQARNRRSNRVLEVGGLRGCISELASHHGIPISRVMNRLNAGWSSNDAFTSPNRIPRLSQDVKKEVRKLAGTLPFRKISEITGVSLTSVQRIIKTK